jgi:hypothetical protein
MSSYIVKPYPVSEIAFPFFNITIMITAKKKVVGLERGPFSLVSTTEELLDRKIAAPV